MCIHKSKVGSFPLVLQAVFLILLLAVSEYAFSKQESGCPVTMNVLAEQETDGDLTLKVRLINKSNEAITISSDKLPWLSNEAMIFVAVPIGGETAIPRSFYSIANFGPPQDVVITSGGQLAGVVIPWVQVDDLRRSPSGITVLWRWHHKVGGRECVLHGSFGYSSG